MPGDDGEDITSSFQPTMEAMAGDPYAWMEHHLHEAASHVAMVQLYREYGHAPREIALSPGLHQEVMDQAQQLMGFVAEQWDEVWGWSQTYYEEVEMSNGCEATGADPFELDEGDWDGDEDIPGPW